MAAGVTRDIKLEAAKLSFELVAGIAGEMSVNVMCRNASLCSTVAVGWQTGLVNVN